MEVTISPENAHLVLAKMIEDRDRKIIELRRKLEQAKRAMRGFHVPELVIQALEEET